MGSQKYFILSVLFTLLIALGLTLMLVSGATSDTITGTFTLNATCSVASQPNFIDSVNAPTSTLTPDNTAIFGVDFDVSHSAGMSDIKNVTLYIYDDSVYGSNYNTSSTDGLQLITITWIESSDTYQVSQGAFSEWTEQSSVDPGSSNSSTTGDFKIRFDISWAARADTDWNATIHVYDDDSGQAEVCYGTESALVTMNNNFDISYSTGTLSWGNDVQPGSTNNTHGAVTIQVRANSAWEVRLNATDFTPGPIDVEANNILMWDEDGSAGGTSQWVRNTLNTLQGTFDAQSAMSTEANLTRNFYVFLTDPGALFSVGQLYTTTLLALIQADV